MVDTRHTNRGVYSNTNWPAKRRTAISDSINYVVVDTRFFLNYRSQRTVLARIVQFEILLLSMKYCRHGSS